MRPRTIIAVGGAVAVLAAATWWTTRPAPRLWSTKSPAALQEFLAGRQALEKFYQVEAADHFRAAVAADPGFCMAHFFLAGVLTSMGQRDAGEAELTRALAADPSALMPRERALVEVARLQHEHKANEVFRALEQYAKEFPGDPDVTRSLAEICQARGDLEAAARWCQVTLEAAPNDALSYNMLGYIEMGRGNFAQAEANLRRYAFIAPDQANPHDSLGELYTVLGRWDDALKEFDLALKANPRFFLSWTHIARVDALRGDGDAAVAAQRQAQAIVHPPAELAAQQLAAFRAYAAFCRGDVGALKEAIGSTAWDDSVPDYFPLRMEAAVRAGDRAAAQQVEDAAAKWLAKNNPKGSVTPGPEAVMHFVRALSLRANGKPADAAREAEAADRLIDYTADAGVVKLAVRCEEAIDLAASGDVAKARAVLASVAAVNPRFPGLTLARREAGVS